jgi:hypothetical protein
MSAATLGIAEFTSVAHSRAPLAQPIPRANRHRPHNMGPVRNAGIGGAGHGPEVEHTEAEAAAGKTRYSKARSAVIRCLSNRP